MAAGTAVGMILGSTVRPAIGGTVCPSASAGVGAVSMPAIGVRLGAGVRVIGDPVIGAAATGVAIGMAIGDIITIMQHPIIVRMQAVRPLMQTAIEVAEEEAVARLTGSLHVIATMGQPLL